MNTIPDIPAEVPVEQLSAFQKFKEIDEKADATLRSTAQQASVYLPGGQLIPLTIRATDLYTKTANDLGDISVGKEPSSEPPTPSATRTVSNVMLATNPLTQIPWGVYHLSKPQFENQINKYKDRHQPITGGNNAKPFRMIFAIVILVIFCLILLEVIKHHLVLTHHTYNNVETNYTTSYQHY